MTFFVGSEEKEKTQMSLSDKMVFGSCLKGEPEESNVLFSEDVKEFIKELKELSDFGNTQYKMNKIIDKLAGDKLI